MSERIEKIKQEKSKLINVDEKQGIIETCILTYNNPDKEEDVNLPGSFARTIKNNLKSIVHCHMHKMDVWLGYPIEFIDSLIQLNVISQFNMQKTFARDIFSDYVLAHSMDRTIPHSSRFISINPERKNTGRGFGDVTKEAMLIEYSTVLMPSDKDAQSIKVKDDFDYQRAFELIERMAKMPYSDEMKIKMENFYNAIIQFQKDGSPIFGSQLAPEQKTPEQFGIKKSEFINILNNL